MICKMSVKILISTIQARDEKYPMISDMISNEKFNPIVSKIFTRGRKLNICIVFIIQSYFKVPKDIRGNSTHYFIMKILNERELQ